MPITIPSFDSSNREHNHYQDRRVGLIILGTDGDPYQWKGELQGWTRITLEFAQSYLTTHPELLEPLPIPRPILRENDIVRTASNYVIQSLYTEPTIPYPEPTECIEEEPHYPNRKTVPEVKRSLLYLLRQVNARWSELSTNYDAYTWGWIHQHWDNLVTKQCRKLEREDLLQDFWETNGAYTKFRRRWIATLKKVTGKDWICDSRSGYWFPSDMYKSYWHGDEEKWIRTEEFEAMKVGKRVIWNEECQEWHSVNTNVTAFRLVNNIQTSLVTHLSGKNIEKYKHCSSCANYWWHEDFKEHPATECSYCVICVNKLITKNESHNLDSVYGDYHSHRSSWKFFIQRLNSEKSLPMGIELEVQIKTNGEMQKEVAWEIYRLQQTESSDWNNIYFERDGSLAADGIECVSNPMTLEYAKTYWPIMLEHFRTYTVGWNAHKYGAITQQYGIHITMSRKYWKDIYIARLLKFLDLKDNRDFVHAISQRSNNYNAKKQVADQLNPKVKDSVTVKNKKISSATMRNQSVNVKSDLVEVRMFASTLNTGSFMKNMEFMDAFYNWCKETAFSTDYTKFLAWLGTHYGHSQRYENLISYLENPKFFCKHRGSFENPFKHLIKGQRGQLDLFPQHLEELVCA